MTDTTSHETLPGRDAEERTSVADPTTSGPIEVVAAETFGWIHPDVADRPRARRTRQQNVTRFGLVAVTLAVIGVVVSWFGPWGAGFGLVGSVLGVVALARRSQPRGWCWAAIGAGMASVAFSAYWVLWALTQLEQLPV